MTGIETGIKVTPCTRTHSPYPSIYHLTCLSTKLDLRTQLRPSGFSSTAFLGTEAIRAEHQVNVHCKNDIQYMPENGVTIKQVEYQGEEINPN